MPRWSMSENVIDPLTGEVVAEAGEIMTMELCDKVQDSGVDAVFIELEENQAFFIGFCDILVDGCHDFGFFPEKLLDLCVCAYAHRTNQHCYGNFSCPVYAYIEYIVGVCFIFQHAASLKVKARLYNRELDELKEQEIFMGDFPFKNHW